MSIKVLLADDHRMMLQGLRSIFDKESDMQVVGEASGGRAALEMVRERSPDVVVMEIGMTDPNGIDATRQIRKQFPGVKVIALSAFSDKRFIMETLEAGASGYVLKTAASEELLSAIRAANVNQRYLSPEIASSVVDSYLSRRLPFDTSTKSILGAREREVLQLLAEGKTSKEMAAVLHISASTVEAHRRNIMKKLNIHSVAGLTKYAIRHGLTTL